MKCQFYFFLFLALFVSHSSLVKGQDFFTRSNEFFQRYTYPTQVDYGQLVKEPGLLQQLIVAIKNYDLRGKSEAERKAFWINAYNLLVIQAVVEKYPIRSPKDVPGFFDRQLWEAAGEKMTLNDLEKEKLINAFADPRIHFALVCAARGCPPLLSGAYFPQRLDEQLEQATRQILNDPQFTQREGELVKISQIFRWYISDFNNVNIFLNQYLEQPIDKQTTLRYYPYDWALNEKSQGKAFQLPFRATYLLQRGQMEIKIFNSVYTQKNLDGFKRANSRSTYFSSFGQALFGVNKKLNLGFDLVYKSNVLNDSAQGSPFKALRFQNFSKHLTFSCLNPKYNITPHSNCSTSPNGLDSLRNFSGDALQTTAAIGLSHFGPKFKINPIRKWQSFTWQQTFFIPIEKKVDGQWVSFSQFFYDRPLGSRFQLFSEISLWTTIAPNFRVFPAVKVFYSYFPNRRWTIYAMTSIPIEYGAGSKFQITPQLEIELLYTHYLPLSFLLGDARPSTFNIGFRYRN